MYRVYKIALVALVLCGIKISAEVKSGYFLLGLPMSRGISIDISELPDSCGILYIYKPCPVIASDFTFHYDFTITASLGIIDLGVFTKAKWKALDSIPQTGYVSSVKRVFQHAYGVKLNENRYAAFYYSYNWPGNDIRNGFEWIYQTNGTNEFKTTTRLIYSNLDTPKIIGEERITLHGNLVQWNSQAALSGINIYDTKGLLIESIFPQGKTGEYLLKRPIAAGHHLLKAIP